MYCISVGVKYRCDFVTDVFGEGEYIFLGHGYIFCKSAVTVYSYDFSFRAEVASIGEAEGALAACDVSFCADALSDFKILNIFSDFHNFSDELVANGCSNGDVLLCPCCVFVNVDVCSAYGCFLDFDEDFVVVNCGDGYFRKPYAFFCFTFYYCFHGYILTLNSFPTSANAFMAWSKFSRVWAALIWVRMRALPFGTTGKQNPIT